MKATLRNTRALILPLALVLASGSAWAGDITGVNVIAPPSGASVMQGATLDGFTAEITSASGKFGAHNAPDVGYCSEFTIDSTGTISCTGTSTLSLLEGTLYPGTGLLPITGDVSVVTYGDTPCNQTYTLSEIFTAPSGSGTDFGSGVTTNTVTFNVTVTCPTNISAGGCSPGFWRNNTSKWPSTVPTTTVVNTIFDGFSTSLGNETLIQALKSPGGGSTLSDKENILLYQAVAAYLNTQVSSIYYPLSENQVTTDVNNALADATANSDSSYLTNEGTTLDTDNNLGGSYCSDLSTD